MMKSDNKTTTQRSPLRIDWRKYAAKPDESIELHTEKTLVVCDLLLSRYQNVIKRLATHLEEEFFFDGNKKESELKSFIRELVQFHDYGKINPVFQDYILKKRLVRNEDKVHSIYSFFIWFVSQSIETVNLDCNTFYKRVAVAYGVITGHHGRLKEWKVLFGESEQERLFKKRLELVSRWLGLDENEYKLIKKRYKEMKKYFKKGAKVTDVYLLTLSKFAFSVLVNSDSVSSSSIPYEEYEQMIEDLFGRDIEAIGFADAYNHMPLIQNVNNSSIKATSQFAEMNDMNGIRTLVNKKVVDSYGKGVDVYLLESAVGTGKTLSSLALANEIIVEERKQKIISVFPLNSVQSQYIGTIQEVGLKEKHLNIVNSESLFGIENNYESETKVQDSNLWLFRRNCFSNEVIITSHVRFFDSFTCVRRKSALGFLSLVDAVVIIDEFQNYRKEYWYQIWSELLTISEILGTKFIFTTGTLPISEIQLEDTYGDRIKKVFTPEENRQLFTSPFVKGRCTIRLLKNSYYNDLNVLKEDILEDIQIQEKAGVRQFIICMSFVRDAKGLYRLFSEKKGYHLYFLCGRHSNEYKQALMKKIKKHNNTPDDKVILVTTKTVECGMDFDFDYGYKEFDRFDSVEQLSGRINRSNKKKNCGLGVFLWERRKLNDEKLYSHNSKTIKDLMDTVNKLNNKEFICLFNELYEKNKIDILSTKKEMQGLHMQCAYAEYEEKMKVIDSENFVTDIYWVLSEKEEDFICEIQEMPKSVSYAEKVQNSMLLQKKLEPYKMNVTNKWLNEMLNGVSQLIEREESGITYYVVIDEEYFMENCIEKYVVGKATSFIESDKYKNVEESTYEFF